MASKERYIIPSSRNARRRKPIIPIVVVVVVLLALISCLLIFKPFQKNSATPAPQDSTTSEKAETPAVKGDSQSQDNPTKTESGNDALIKEKTPVKYEGEGAATDSITGVITYVAANPSNFVIRVSIDQYLTDGTCELVLSGPSSYTATAPVAPEASTSTCQGFDIPLSALTPGEYDIRINITSGSLAGTLTGKGAI